MARTVNLSGKDVKKSENTGFAPLPAGKYNVTVFDLDEGEYKNGVNKGRPFLKLQLRISDGQKGANRRLFVNVGDFPYWKNKDGSGSDGASNFLYWQFYKSLGVVFPGKDEEDEVEVVLPDLEEIEGASLAVKVKIVKDEYAYNKAMAAWEDEAEKAEAKGKDAPPRPEPDDFLKNEVAEFLPEIDPDDLASDGDDSDDFGL